MSRLGTSLAKLIAKAETPPRLGIQAPGRPLTETFDRLQRYRLAWYSARKGRMVLRANIAEALKPHIDRRAIRIVENPHNDRAVYEPRWCDVCGVPYPCHTRRMLTRPPMEADQ